MGHTWAYEGGIPQRFSRIVTSSTVAAIVSPLLSLCMCLTFRDIRNMELNESISEGTTQLLSPAVSARRVLCGKQKEGRVGFHNLTHKFNH